MAFWGVEVKPGKPFTVKASQATEIRRLHLSQATLGLGNATIRSILQCNVGNKSPLFLCILSPEKVESCQLNLEFEEADEVIFSVIGPRSVHLTGYFLSRSSFNRGNDDESESFGEDIVETDVDSGSSDDYDYNSSFIDDDDPSSGRGLDDSSSDDYGSNAGFIDDDVDPSSGRGLEVSSSDDEVSIKEMLAKTKAKKRNEKGERLKKKYQISDSESTESSTMADDSSDGDFLDNPLPPTRSTRSKARNSTLENVESNSKCKKTSETGFHSDDKVMDKREDKSLGDVELFLGQKNCVKRKKEKRKISVIVSSDEERENIPEDLQNAKPVIDKEIKSATDVSPFQQQNGETIRSKKKRKRDRKEETTEVQKSLSECSVNKKQAIDKNMDSEIDTKKLVEPEDSESGVIIEELKKGNLEGKSAVRGKKVSILYTGKLKNTGKLIDSNLGEAPLRFRLGRGKVIKGLDIGVEGMRVGEKRRLIIPPSLGYSEAGLKEDVPKNAWLVYEVEAVKIR